MKTVVINNLKRTKFHSYCDDYYEKRHENWAIEFPKSELGKLAPFCRAGGTARFEKEDGSVEEWNCPTAFFVKNHRFIYNDRPCDIFGSIAVGTNEKGEEVCFANALFPIQD